MICWSLGNLFNLYLLFFSWLVRICYRKDFFRVWQPKLFNHSFSESFIHFEWFVWGSTQENIYSKRICFLFKPKKSITVKFPTGEIIALQLTRISINSNKEKLDFLYKPKKACTVNIPTSKASTIDLISIGIHSFPKAISLIWFNCLFKPKKGNTTNLSTRRSFCTLSDSYRHPFQQLLIWFGLIAYWSRIR